jgi:hypothetical protein
MTWTMMTVILNIAGGQPVVLPGYQYTSEEACKAALYETKRIPGPEAPLSGKYGIVSAVCVPVDPSAMGLGTGE